MRFINTFIWSRSMDIKQRRRTKTWSWILGIKWSQKKRINTETSKSRKRYLKHHQKEAAKMVWSCGEIEQRSLDKTINANSSRLLWTHEMTIENISDFAQDRTWWMKLCHSLFVSHLAEGIFFLYALLY